MLLLVLLVKPFGENPRTLMGLSASGTCLCPGICTRDLQPPHPDSCFDIQLGILLGCKKGLIALATTNWHLTRMLTRSQHRESGEATVECETAPYGSAPCGGAECASARSAIGTCAFRGCPAAELCRPSSPQREGSGPWRPARPGRAAGPWVAGPGSSCGASASAAVGPGPQSAAATGRSGHGCPGGRGPSGPGPGVRLAHPCGLLRHTEGANTELGGFRI